MKLKNMYEDKKTGKLLFETGILIMIMNILCVTGIWQSISNNWKVADGGNLFFQGFIQSDGKYVITYLNQESIYISFLSVLFSFLGNKEELVSIINLILQLAGVGFFYLGAKKLFSFAIPLAVAVICSFVSGWFYPVITDSSMHMVWFLSGLFFWMIAKSFRDISGLFLKHLLLGILLGIYCYIDISGFLLLITCIIFTLFAKEFKLKERGLQLLLFFLCSINGFFCMFYLWNNFLFDKVACHQWFQNKMKFFRTEYGMKQYLSLIIVLAVCVVFYGIKYFKTCEDTSSVELDAVFKQIVQAEEREQEILSQIGTATDEEQTPEEKKPINFIENPLPLPKKHVKKEMNYAFEPSSDQMHYDLNNYSFDDDYDLKDL